MGVRTHVGTYVRRYAAHTYVRIAAEQILRCVCLEKGAWLRAHVRVAGSGQRRRRSEKEKGPISYVRCAYVRTYLVQSSDTYADVRAYIRTYVRVYVQNALRTFVIRTYSRGSRSAMREEPVNQGHALPHTRREGLKRQRASPCRTHTRALRLSLGQQGLCTSLLP